LLLRGERERQGLMINMVKKDWRVVSSAFGFRRFGIGRRFHLAARTASHHLEDTDGTADVALQRLPSSMPGERGQLVAEPHRQATDQAFGARRLLIHGAVWTGAAPTVLSELKPMHFSQARVPECARVVDKAMLRRTWRWRSVMSLKVSSM
jgi:hypothetical protein